MKKTVRKGSKVLSGIAAVALINAAVTTVYADEIVSINELLPSAEVAASSAAGNNNEDTSEQVSDDNAAQLQDEITSEDSSNEVYAEETNTEVPTAYAENGSESGAITDNSDTVSSGEAENGTAESSTASESPVDEGNGGEETDTGTSNDGESNQESESATNETVGEEAPKAVDGIDSEVTPPYTDGLLKYSYDSKTMDLTVSCETTNGFKYPGFLDYYENVFIPKHNDAGSYYHRDDYDATCQPWVGIEIRGKKGSETVKLDMYEYKDIKDLTFNISHDVSDEFDSYEVALWLHFDYLGSYGEGLTGYTDYFAKFDLDKSVFLEQGKSVSGETPFVSMGEDVPVNPPSEDEPTTPSIPEYTPSDFPRPGGTINPVVTTTKKEDKDKNKEEEKEPEKTYTVNNSTNVDVMKIEVNMEKYQNSIDIRIDKNETPSANMHNKIAEYADKNKTSRYAYLPMDISVYDIETEKELKNLDEGAEITFFLAVPEQLYKYRNKIKVLHMNGDKLEVIDCTPIVNTKTGQKGIKFKMSSFSPTNLYVDADDMSDYEYEDIQSYAWITDKGEEVYDDISSGSCAYATGEVAVINDTADTKRRFIYMIAELFGAAALVAIGRKRKRS